MGELCGAVRGFLRLLELWIFKKPCSNTRGRLQMTSLTSGITTAMESSMKDLVREGCQVIEVDKTAHRAVGTAT